MLKCEITVQIGSIDNVMKVLQGMFNVNINYVLFITSQKNM